MDVSEVAAMKQRLCDVFHRQVSTMSHRAKRKLVLHFDVNKTVVPVDSATGECVEDALNVFLSGQAWGTEMGGEWTCSREELSDSPVENDAVSFYKFEEGRLLKKISEDRSAFRRHMKSFTDKPQGKSFKPHLNSLLQQLRWRHPYDESVHRQLTVPGSENVRYHYILPAFFRLLSHLVEEERDFTIVFRTYGTDATGLLQCLATSLSLPLYQDLQHLAGKVSQSVSNIARNADGHIELNLVKDNQYRVLSDEADIYQTLCASSGIWAIKDDVGCWNRNHFHPSAGKPVWVDQQDEGTSHIFFDDNIRPGMEDSIVDLRLRNGACDFRPVSRSEERTFVNANLVPVNFSQAVMDDDYFIKNLRVCEERLSSMSTKIN